MRRFALNASLIVSLLAVSTGCGDDSADNDTNASEDSGRPGRDASTDRDTSDDAGTESDTAESPDDDVSVPTPDVATEDTSVEDTTQTDTVVTDPGANALSPCGGSNPACDEGLDCLSTGSDGEGFCMLPCGAGGSCGDVRGTPAICALGVVGEPDPTYCVPLCESQDDCPDGTTCESVTAQISVCTP